MVASLHSVDLKPLQTLFYGLPLLAELVFANYTLTDPSLQQHDWAKENMMQKNAKESKRLVPKD